MINLFSNSTTNKWEIWTDTDAGERDGRCLAVGNSEHQVIEEAMTELLDDLVLLVSLRKHPPGNG
jgi:hypothetical protein